MKFDTKGNPDKSLPQAAEVALIQQGQKAGW